MRTSPSEKQKPGAAATATGLNTKAQTNQTYRSNPSASSGGVTTIPAKRITARRRASWRLAQLYRLAAYRRFNGVTLDPNTWAFCLASTLASAAPGISPVGIAGRAVRWHGLDMLTLKKAIKEADLGEFSDDELGTIIEAVSRWQKQHPYEIIKADKLAVMLGVTAEERAFCNMTTVGAIDEPADKRAARAAEARAVRNRERIRTKRAGKHKPRPIYLASALAASKPWEAEGISRATWYRRQNDRETGLSPYQLALNSQGDRPVSGDASEHHPDREEIAA